MPDSNCLSVKHLTVCYDRKPALWEAQVSIPQGTMTGIVGPNGAGKSTFLKAILDLIPATSGSVKFFGEDYRKVRHRIRQRTLGQRQKEAVIAAVRATSWVDVRARCGVGHERASK